MSTTAKAAFLVALGSLVGLSVAAAIRWLNGGDFVLLPPAIADEDNHHHPQRLTLQQQQQQQHSRLEAQIEALLQALQAQSLQQEQLLVRLKRDDAKETDQSMNLLRKNSTSNTHTAQVVAKLSNVQAALAQLRDSITSRNEENDKQVTDHQEQDQWEERMEETMQQLQTVLKDLGAKSTQQVDSPEKTPSAVATSSRTTRGVTTATPLSVSLVNAATSMATALGDLVLKNDRQSLLVGTQLLYLYVVNLASHPKVPRYRKIFTSNESFQKVDKLVGGRDFLVAIGFVEQDQCLEWLARTAQDDDDDHKTTDTAEDAYLPLLDQASAALRVLKAPGRSVNNELLLKEALACITSSSSSSSLVETVPANGEKSSPGSPNMANGVPPTSCHTPETGSIISPPMTKKQSFPPNHGFPPSHPLASLDETVQSDESGEFMIR